MFESIIFFSSKVGWCSRYAHWAIPNLEGKIILKMHYQRLISLVSWKLSQKKSCEAPRNPHNHLVYNTWNMFGPPIMNLELRMLNIYQNQNSCCIAKKPMVLLVENLDIIEWLKVATIIELPIKRDTTMGLSFFERTFYSKLVRLSCVEAYFESWTSFCNPQNCERSLRFDSN